MAAQPLHDDDGAEANWSQVGIDKGLGARTDSVLDYRLHMSSTPLATALPPGRRTCRRKSGISLSGIRIGRAHNDVGSGYARPPGM